jgi:thiol-disulfide isomerase/thioredoxin
MQRHKAKHARQMIAVAFTALALGCGSGSHTDYQGDMDDFSYGGRRDKSYGTSASGRQVGLADYSGRFVWVDYSAPWCGPCLRQAPTIQRLEHAYGDKVVFLTVLTSDDKPGAPSTRYTARRWAKQFRLDPDRVVAGSEWQRTIPQHAVFSPLGQTLYWQVGLHSDAQIRGTLQRLMRDWEQWHADNKGSLSVLLSEIGD